MFTYTEEEKNHVLELFFESKNPLVLGVFPSRQKRKFLCMLWIVEKIEKNKPYTEQKINELLKPIYNDFVSLRRYLVDFKLLKRTPDGSVYFRA